MTTTGRSGFTIDEQAATFLDNLNSLDFGPLAYKLMHPEDGIGLSLEQTADAITKYKGFLFLCQACEGRSISPSRYIDFVWHNHILDTELYFVQSGILYGNYLHHFPFFGKRGDDDERYLLEAADFTKRQALNYFDWDDDDWCGTGRRPKWPRSDRGLADLVGAIFPAGGSGPAIDQNPDTITIQAGNFRHIVEYRSPYPASSYFWPRRFAELSNILKLPIWVIVCKPVEIDILSGISVIRERERLAEIAQNLVANRLAPEGFSPDLVHLRLVN
jgi:hypothetical protein